VNDWAIVRQPSQNKLQSSGRLFSFLSDSDAKHQIALSRITATCERRKYPSIHMQHCAHYLHGHAWCRLQTEVHWHMQSVWAWQVDWKTASCDASHGHSGEVQMYVCRLLGMSTQMEAWRSHVSVVRLVCVPNGRIPLPVGRQCLRSAANEAAGWPASRGP
jgi:hypothetical protein